ncbi:MAG: hypothetical protein HXY40_07560 [Chloroflexi bacterium]|nr:hypothetical protein [Chloroflexota bacterium]
MATAGSGRIANTVWPLLGVLPLAHFGVISGEEGYLERKFGAGDVNYKARGRRRI